MLDCCRAQSKSCHVGLVRLKIQVPDQAQVQEANKKKSLTQTPVYFCSCQWHSSPAPSLFITLSPTTTALSIQRRVKTRYHDVVKMAPLRPVPHMCPAARKPQRMWYSICINTGSAKWLALHSCGHDICNDASRLVATPPLDTTASFSHVHSPIRCPPPGTVIHGSDPLDHLPWFLSRHHVLVATALHLEVAQAGFVRLAKVVVLVVAG